MSLLFPPRPEDFKFPDAKSPRLRIVSYCDDVCDIIVRGVTKTGLLHYVYLTTSNRQPETRIIYLTEIPLVLHVETITPRIQRGQLFVQIFLEFAGVPGTILAADYITTSTPLSWPGGGIRAATEDRGAIVILTPADYPTGANFAYNIVVNELIKILAIFITFTTSATAATRELIIKCMYAGVYPISFARPAATQIASLTRNYSFTDYLSVPAAYADNIAGHLPNVFLNYGDKIVSDVQNIQATDTFDNISILAEKWLSP